MTRLSTNMTMQTCASRPRYASINGGASAFSVRGWTREQAIQAATVEVLNPPLWREPGSMVEARRLLVYTPQEWTAHCIRTHHAQPWSESFPGLVAQAREAATV